MTALASVSRYRDGNNLAKKVPQKQSNQIPTILNPLWENRKHVNALEKKLGLQPFIPAVVFTHAKLIDDFGPIAVYIDQLQKFIIGYTRRLIDLDNLESVVGILNKGMGQSPS